MQNNNNTCLPLISPVTCTRNIKVESCILDNNHHQIRGELTEKHTDYENSNIEIDNQCIVIRLVLRVDDKTITNAEFAMPKPPFPDICEHMPLGPDLLIGLKVDTGITKKIDDLYDKTQTCSDLQILLQSMIRLIPAISAINGIFRWMDDSLPAEGIPDSMKLMSQHSHNVCHAFSGKKGSMQQYIANGNYDKMLSRIGNRILKRWEIFNRSEKSKKK